MTPDTDEQLNYVADKYGFELRQSSTNLTMLRALINHYIALDRAQGQEPVGYIDNNHLATTPDGRIRLKSIRADVIWKDKVFESATPFYTHAQPIAEAKKESDKD
jgi:hypothetical protein